MISRWFQFEWIIGSPWWLGEKVIFLSEDQLLKSRRAASCIACEPCSLLVIHRLPFLEVVSDAHLGKWLADQKKKLRTGDSWGCQHCGSDDHWFRECPNATDAMILSEGSRGSRQIRDSKRDSRTAEDAQEVQAEVEDEANADRSCPRPRPSFRSSAFSHSDMQNDEANAVSGGGGLQDSPRGAVADQDAPQLATNEHRIRILDEKVDRIFGALHRLEEVVRNFSGPTGQSASSVAVTGTTEDPSSKPSGTGHGATEPHAGRARRARARRRTESGTWEHDCPRCWGARL